MSAQTKANLWLLAFAANCAAALYAVFSAWQPDAGAACGDPSGVLPQLYGAAAAGLAIYGAVASLRLSEYWLRAATPPSTAGPNLPAAIDYAPGVNWRLNDDHAAATMTRNGRPLAVIRRGVDAAGQTVFYRTPPPPAFPDFWNQPHPDAHRMPAASCHYRNPDAALAEAHQALRQAESSHPYQTNPTSGPVPAPQR